MHPRRTSTYGMIVIFSLILGACSPDSLSGTLPDIQPSILQVEPEQPDCPVSAGQWMAFRGRNFGRAEDWKDGTNQVIFFDQVIATQVELTREDNPATLFLRVPEGAQTGPVIVRVEGRESSAFQVTVVSRQDVHSQLAVPTCNEVTPP
jgi:hypothetical protein